MTKYNCDSPIHKVSSLILAFIILSCCVLPSFAHADEVEPSPSYPPIHPNIPVGYKDGDTFRDIMLALFDDWGINFSKPSSDSQVSILEYGDQLLEEFYEANNTSKELFWDAVKYGVNEVGNIILDFTGVNAIRSVANWLINKYNLSDNSSTSVGTFDSTSFVPIPYYSGNDTSGVLSHGANYFFTNGYAWKQITNYSLSPIYHCWIAPNYPSLTNSYSYFFSLTPASAFTISVWSYNNRVFSGTYSLSSQRGPVYYLLSPGGYSSNDSLVSGSSTTSYPVFSSLEALYSALDSSFSSDIVISTDVISIPSENDISPTDGIEIEIPGTNWGDSIYTILELIERLIVLYDNTQLEVISVVDTLENLIANLQHSVTVENIPGAVTLDYNDYDIPIENEWGLFDIFFNTGGDEITLLRPWQELRSIIYGFPSPVISFFVLVVLFVVAYGFIRMGRDSH